MQLFKFFLFSLSSLAADQIPDTDMHAVAKEVMVLQKYLFTGDEFTTPANEAPIRNSLDGMNHHLARLEKNVFAEQPALRLNVALLSRQVADADRSFRSGQKPLARYLLVSSLPLCVACHTRSASPDFVLPDAELQNASRLDKASFYFATRQFDKGRELYEQALAAPKEVSPAALRNAALSLALYYARVKKDPTGGRNAFRKIAKEKLPDALRADARAWAADFSAWAKEKPAPETARSGSELVAEARKILAGDSARVKGKEVKRLRASSLLHEALELKPDRSAAKGQAMLLLGEIYDRLDSPLFHRFGEMHWKACISEYKKEKIAQECYQQLERATLARTGAEGGHGTPGAEEVELMQLKRLAY